MNDLWLLVAIVAAVGFGIAVGYPVGLRNGRADRLSADVSRRVAFDTDRVIRRAPTPSPPRRWAMTFRGATRAQRRSPDATFRSVGKCAA